MDIHSEVMEFVTEPVCHPEDLMAPICRCRKDNLSTETVMRFKKDDLMTT